MRDFSTVTYQILTNLFKESTDHGLRYFNRVYKIEKLHLDTGKRRLYITTLLIVDSLSKFGRSSVVKYRHSNDSMDRF